LAVGLKWKIANNSNSVGRGLATAVL